MDRSLEKLKNAGYKLTPRRKAMLQIFARRDKHLSAEEVWIELGKKFRRCGLPGVYRNLESLTECGILASIRRPDRKKHYGLCKAEHQKHHHHITCIKCGKVEEIEACAIKEGKSIKGYKVVSHFMQVDGICSACLGK
jgi:Fur family transcriptional regulator, ferric uptake regulator